MFRFIHFVIQITGLYGSSFLPSVIREWNRLPNEHRNAESQTAFKRYLTENAVKIPQYFFRGNRIEQILHTQLRTEWSSVNYYLYRRNLVLIPNALVELQKMVKTISFSAHGITMLGMKCLID